jgi:hypothetical protein
LNEKVIRTPFLIFPSIHLAREQTLAADFCPRIAFSSDLTRVECIEGKTSGFSVDECDECELSITLLVCEREGKDSDELELFILVTVP